MIAQLLSKSRQALATAERALDGGDADAAANRWYYAVFCASWAMFTALGLEETKTHNELVSEFGRRFVKDGPL